MTRSRARLRRRPRTRWWAWATATRATTARRRCHSSCRAAKPLAPLRAPRPPNPRQARRLAATPGDRHEATDLWKKRRRCRPRRRHSVGAARNLLPLPLGSATVPACGLWAARAPGCLDREAHHLHAIHHQNGGTPKAKGTSRPSMRDCWREIEEARPRWGRPPLSISPDGGGPRSALAPRHRCWVVSTSRRARRRAPSRGWR